MFLRSKYEKIGEDGIINAPINTSHIECIGVEDKAILFDSHDEMYSWVYVNTENRDQEYNWILSKLNAVKNDGSELSGLDHL